MNSYDNIIKAFAQYGLDYDELSRQIQEALSAMSPYYDISITNDSIFIPQEIVNELL